MATVAKSKTQGKGHYSDKFFYYINVLDIENGWEWQRLYEKIQAVVEADK